MEKFLNVVALVAVVICSTVVVNIHANRDAGAVIAVQQKEVIEQYHNQNVTYRDVVRELSKSLREAREDYQFLQEKMEYQTELIAFLQSELGEDYVEETP